MDELASGRFQEFLADSTIEPSKVSRILLCSGKVYYDLLAGREQRGAQDVAIIRVEQLYPFLLPEFYDLLARHPLTAEVCWVQEEPKNMGSWIFIQDQLQPVLDLSKRTLRYIGRGESASPSAGSLKRHQEEQAYIVEEAFAEAPLPKKTRRLVPKKKK